MKVVGIVCEYNPFHNGHWKQLEAVHAAGGTAVCLMSGNYVQRGEPALIDKWTRAKAAALCGADLVLELPLTYALRSAEGFAAGGVEIFSRLGCVQAMCFGSESGNADDIMSTARRLQDEAFPSVLKAELKRGVSFPKARQLALEALGADASLLEKPNDILAVEYAKALLSTEIEPMVLRRIGSYYDSMDCENPSASYLRSIADWCGFVPEAAQAVYAHAAHYRMEAGERAMLARLRAMEDAEFAALPYGSEGLWRKVMHACRQCATVEGILESAKSKRYTRTRLMRLLLCAYLGITKEYLEASAPYIRVLAMNAAGQAVLKAARKNGRLLLLHTGEQAPEGAYAELERRATRLYGLFCTEQVPSADAERKARVFRVEADC